MGTYVLVGGAWIGAWAWRDVAAQLRSEGPHEVFAVTLTGLAERSHLSAPGVDLETHVTDVVAALHYTERTDIILVGHSYAGTVVAAAADRAPQLVEALVYVDTAPLPTGLSTIDFAPPSAQEAMRAQVGTGWTLPLPPREDLPGDASDFDDSMWTRMQRLATPHPFGSFTQPVTYTGVDHGHRRFGIACRNGQQMLAFARSQPDNPMFADLLSDVWTWFYVDAGHWPMLTRPEELATLLAKGVTSDGSSP